VGAETGTDPQEALVHANARLTIHARRLLIERIMQGRPIAHVADEMGVSRQTAYKWWARWRHHGDAGLHDRSSRPRCSPMRTSRRVEQRIVSLRQRTKHGPARLAGITELPASTVYRVLVRAGLNRRDWMDRPTGRVIRRINTSQPGELVHIDVKKLGAIPTGGGWRVHGRGNVAHHSRTRGGFTFIHSAVDAYSRLAYSEALDDETTDTAVGFWMRAHAWFAAHDVRIERVLTDNGACYKQRFSAAVTDLGVRHTRTRPYRPQTNGKVERFNRTLLDEWAYVRVYRSETARRTALVRWLHLYNHHRAHTALDGQPPISRVNNVAAQHN
jgi:transposase InsO family protein